MSIFKESADIKTADMLNLPVPEAEYENVVLKPTEYQKEIVAALGERADAVLNRRVRPDEDNMLKITMDGRKVALNQRLFNDMLPDDENSKAAVCVDKAFKIWEETKENQSTQLIFCDQSTPTKDGSFNVYDDVKQKLMAKGVPEKEIAFIHNANTDQQKKELFEKVRKGEVRFLLGSTAKMGAGTNVQDRLIALHHLDVPWRPSDLEQQEGRILRQGNTNEKVKIFRYITEGTFDGYSWQIIENKLKSISQIMTSKSPARRCEDVDEAVLSASEAKALSVSDPRIKEKMELDNQVTKLKLLKANYQSQKYHLEDEITQTLPRRITALKQRISALKADIQSYTQNKPKEEENFSITINGKHYEDKNEAGAAMIEAAHGVKGFNTVAEIGEYLGFKLSITFESLQNKFILGVKGQQTLTTPIGMSAIGNITRLNNVLENLPEHLEEAVNALKEAEHGLETAKEAVQLPFEKEEELKTKMTRLAELNALLNVDEKEEANSVEAADAEKSSVRENASEEVGVDTKEDIVNEKEEGADVKEDRINAREESVDAREESTDVKEKSVVTKEENSSTEEKMADENLSGKKVSDLAAKVKSYNWDLPADKWMTDQKISFVAGTKEMCNVLKQEYFTRNDALKLIESIGRRPIEMMVASVVTQNKDKFTDENASWAENVKGVDTLVYRTNIYPIIAAYLGKSYLTGRIGSLSKFLNHETEQSKEKVKEPSQYQEDIHTDSFQQTVGETVNEKPPVKENKSIMEQLEEKRQIVASQKEEHHLQNREYGYSL